jgi:hypothetical protein
VSCASDGVPAITDPTLYPNRSLLWPSGRPCCDVTALSRSFRDPLIKTSVLRRWELGFQGVSELRNYRAFAMYCERMSRESRTAERRASWLALAADWLSLITETSPEHSGRELLHTNRTASGTAGAKTIGEATAQSTLIPSVS